MKSQAGMNIIELMIVVTIIGLVLALAGPSAATWIQNMQLRNAADSIVGGVQFARTEALKRNTFVSFQLTDANSTAWVVCIYDPIGNACSGAVGATLNQKGKSEGSPNAKVGSDVNVGDVTVGLPAGSNIPAQVTFDSFGRPAATAPNNIQRVDVRNPVLSLAEERRMVILVGTNGAVRMCDPKLSKAVNPQGCI